MRLYLFGWICKLRGFHRSKSFADVVGGVDPESGAVVTLTMLRFRCVCGAVTHRNADMVRGGKVPVPVTWRDGL